MQQAATSVVTVSHEQNGVALIHLNRPPANSYDRRFIDELNAAIDEIRFDESVAAAVLASDLPKFSAPAPTSTCSGRSAPGCAR